MNFLKTLLRKSETTAAVLEAWFFASKFLQSKGWFKSRFQRMPVDQQEQPIPWLTYSAIHFIEQKLQSNFKIFEFGSGNSTLWFAKRVQEIISIEHEADYYNLIKDKLLKLPNVVYKHLKLGVPYTSEILKYQEYFDIVIIDGRDRIACAKNSLQALKSNGIIIWDNSDRERYQEGYDYLINNGFKRIDFRGAAPISHGELQTSVFYRKENCFFI